MIYCTGAFYCGSTTAMRSSPNTHRENSEMRTTVFLYKMNKLKQLHVERAGYLSYKVTYLGDNLIFIIVAKCLIIHIGC